MSSSWALNANTGKEMGGGISQQLHYNDKRHHVYQNIMKSANWLIDYSII